MTNAELLRQLEQRKIRLAVSDGDLKVLAKHGVLTLQLLAEIKDRKAAIVSYLTSSIEYWTGLLRRASTEAEVLEIVARFRRGPFSDAQCAEFAHAYHRRLDQLKSRTVR